MHEVELVICISSMSSGETILLAWEHTEKIALDASFSDITSNAPP
jgi:hypothetical protein